ncbi:Ubiquitin-like protein [Spathaspora sp. JA1]|nr:Ubiquitin-like protein [Spathaspora sp. JA1]
MSDTEQPKEEKPDSTTHINLKVSDGSAEIFFKIKRSTPMKRLMEAFCKRQGKDMNSLRFLIDGTRVYPHNTPDELELEDGDTIEAHREQTGGAYL